MATLQKFKFLAAQCAMIGSPTRSPTASPVVHLRRRKTLRMLLGRTASGKYNHRRFHRREESPDRRRTEDKSAQIGRYEDHRSRKQHRISVRSKLKDLLVSSPPPLGESAKKMEQGEIQRLLPTTGCPNEGFCISGGEAGGSCGGVTVGRRIGGAGVMRPLTATLRQRLLRRAWRPVLVAIPEHSP